ncbi:unnamed protein product [Parascedosporium putredinis]|uniref:Uncharacterized protein n=1 Tax=Parascedosporium putredinis TaxID=1442378 RepID=A0A9P1MDF5_9PEZI|nr:unnamed protein product [Parascedosporium putredinis]CAI8002464.1 unnamed protein product [Parascedosporium putredinis]
MKFTQILAAAAISTHTALAVPDVVAKPLFPGSCTGFPTWQNVRGSDLTGAFELVVDQTGDDGVDGLPTRSDDIKWGNETIKMIHADLRKSRMFARPRYACTNGAVSHAVLQFAPGYDVEVYSHTVDGVEQPGKFIGALNQTTWGFAYVQPTECGKMPYYEAMLQGLPVDPDTEHKAAWPPEFFGFIRAQS